MSSNFSGISILFFLSKWEMPVRPTSPQPSNTMKRRVGHEESDTAGRLNNNQGRAHETSTPHSPLPSQLDTPTGHQSRADYIPPLSLLASSTTVLLTFTDSAVPSLAPCSPLTADSSSLRFSSLQDFHIVNALT